MKQKNGGHRFHKCGNDECHICEGGLGWCTICGGFEGSLLTVCPGFALTQEALDACYNGNVKDFLWFKLCKKEGARIINGKIVWR